MCGLVRKVQPDEDQPERFEDRFYSWKLQRELTWGVIAFTCLTGTIQLIAYLGNAISWFSISIDILYLGLSFGFSYSILYLGKLFRTNPQNSESKFYTEKLQKYMQSIEGKHYEIMKSPIGAAVIGAGSFVLWVIILLSKLGILGTPVQVTDSSTFGISVVGIAVSSIYISTKFRPCWQKSLTEDVDRTTKDTLTEWLKKFEGSQDDGKGFGKCPEIVLRDYEASSEEIGRRDNILLLVGTILIGSSLLILGTAAQLGFDKPHYLFALGSVGLYTIYLLIMYETAVFLNSLTYKRITAIEGALSSYLTSGDRGKEIHYEFGIHTFIRKNTKDQRRSWLCLRRSFWGTLLLFLSLIWLLSSIKVPPI